LVFVVNQKDHKNCRIQLLIIVIFHKSKQNRKSDDEDDDAVHQLCSQSSQSADCYSNTIQVHIDMSYVK